MEPNELYGGTGDDHFLRQIDSMVRRELCYIYSAATQIIYDYDTITFDADDKVILNTALGDSLEVLSASTTAESISQAVEILAATLTMQLPSSRCKIHLTIHRQAYGC